MVRPTHSKFKLRYCKETLASFLFVTVLDDVLRRSQRDTATNRTVILCFVLMKDTLTHSFFFVPQVSHKASTRERHCYLFAACLVMVSQISLHAFISFSMFLRQVSLGRPLSRFPSGVLRRAVLGSVSSGIRHTHATVISSSSQLG